MSTLINIGRQFGSGGGAVARAVGARLGIQVYDNQLITQAARESGLSEELFQRSDERKRRFAFSDIFSTDRFGFGQSALDENALFRIQSGTIRNIAERESAVIIGRCSNYVLRDRRCLDVFISAPDEFRIERIMGRLGCSAAQAAEEIRKRDRSRADYYGYFTRWEWGAAEDYDLCLDSSLLGIEGTADFIIDFGRKAGLIDA